MKLELNIADKIAAYEIKLAPVFKRIDEVKNLTQIKVLEAFKAAGIQNSHYAWVTGYGYDDLGKDKIEEVYAHYFSTEAALVRPQLVSGTHAISAAVMGNLNSGDEIVFVTGKPYDTLQTVFKQYQEKYKINCKYGAAELSSNTRIAFIQRSRGYEWRDSLSQLQLKEILEATRKAAPQAIIFVDNCYGEFTQLNEPTHLGADLVAGSLIKNPGGGIVAAGAYIAGRQDCVQAAAEFMTAPGIGSHGGCMFDQSRLYLQGFFIAPLIVSEALKGMSLAALAINDMGLETIPSYDAERNDVIQAIKFNDRSKLIDFCKLVQQNSPVNSIFTPVPSAISGYGDEIIMAAGTFIEGSSIELSADAPLREPYIGYLQGGMSYAHTRYVISKLIEAII